MSRRQEFGTDPDNASTRPDSSLLSAHTALRSLPSVEKLLASERLAALASRFSHPAITNIVRRQLETARAGIRDGAPPPSFDEIVAVVEARARDAWTPWPRRLVNATGVILHTNLGRAPLSKAATEAAAAAAAGYADLEIALATGRRGSRLRHISELLAQATGAEAGLVVNNNAAAVFLTLSALAAGREVIVSRGEAVEIGGGFRVPDVLRQSGAELVEVGTTNRTYASDYAAAITERTAAILRVHASNFVIRGFTHQPDLPELVELGKRRAIPVVHDLGSGCLLDTTAYGLAREPMAQDSVRAGVDLSAFSGDKLLGGPQAGIVVGRRDLIDRLSRHPLARALRVEKTTLAALSATLTAYITDSATAEIPVWRMISAPLEEMRRRAERWLAALGGPSRRAGLREGRSTIGGGSLPGETLPTTLLWVRPDVGAERFSARLRRASTPVMARIGDDVVLLDPRTVLDGEDDIVIAALETALDSDA